MNQIKFKLKNAIGSNQKQIKNFLIYASTDGLSQALPFLVLPIIAGALGAENFGLVANFTVMIQLYTAILGMRMVFFYTADFHKADDQRRGELISNIVFFYMAMGLFLLLLTFLTGDILSQHLLLHKKWQFLALFIVFLLMIGQLLTSHLRMKEEVKAFGRLMLTRSFISAGGSLLFVIALDWSYPGRFYAMLASAIFLGGSALFFFIRNGYLKWKWQWTLQKELLFFGLPMLPYALSPWLKGGFEKIFITSQLGLAENGIYALATSFSAIFSLVATAFMSTYTPTMYKILSDVEKNQKEAGKEKIVKQILFFIVGFSLVLVFGYGLLYFVFHWFFDETYQQALSYLPLVFAVVALAAFTNLFKSLIIYTKKTKLFGVVGLTMALVQVPLTYGFISAYGIIGAPLAGLIGAFLMLVSYIGISHKYLPLPWRTVLLSYK